MHFCRLKFRHVYELHSNLKYINPPKLYMQVGTCTVGTHNTSSHFRYMKLTGHNDFNKYLMIFVILAIQSILSQIGLQNNLQMAPQQLISQFIPASTSEQTSITQDQQYVTQQSDMTVVDPLATSSPPTAAELINHVTTTSRAVLPSLQDSSLQDQYVQQQDYQV